MSACRTVNTTNAATAQKVSGSTSHLGIIVSCKVACVRTIAPNRHPTCDHSLTDSNLKLPHKGRPSGGVRTRKWETRHEALAKGY